MPSLSKEDCSKNIRRLRAGQRLGKSLRRAKKMQTTGLGTLGKVYEAGSKMQTSGLGTQLGKVPAALRACGLGRSSFTSLAGAEKGRREETSSVRVCKKKNSYEFERRPKRLLLEHSHSTNTFIFDMLFY